MPTISVKMLGSFEDPVELAIAGGEGIPDLQKFVRSTFLVPAVLSPSPREEMLLLDEVSHVAFRSKDDLDAAGVAEGAPFLLATRDELERQRGPRLAGRDIDTLVQALIGSPTAGKEATSAQPKASALVPGKLFARLAAGAAPTGFLEWRDLCGALESFQKVVVAAKRDKEAQLGKLRDVARAFARGQEPSRADVVALSDLLAKIKPERSAHRAIWQETMPHVGWKDWEEASWSLGPWESPRVAPYLQRLVYTARLAETDGFGTAEYELLTTERHQAHLSALTHLLLALREGISIAQARRLLNPPPVATPAPLLVPPPSPLPFQLSTPTSGPQGGAPSRGASPEQGMPAAQGGAPSTVDRPKAAGAHLMTTPPAAPPPGSGGGPGLVADPRAAAWPGGAGGSVSTSYPPPGYAPPGAGTVAGGRADLGVAADLSPPAGRRWGVHFTFLLLIGLVAGADNAGFIPHADVSSYVSLCVCWAAAAHGPRSWLVHLGGVAIAASIAVVTARGVPAGALWHPGGLSVAADPELGVTFRTKLMGGALLVAIWYVAMRIVFAILSWLRPFAGTIFLGFALGVLAMSMMLRPEDLVWIVRGRP